MARLTRRGVLGGVAGVVACNGNDRPPDGKTPTSPPDTGGTTLTTGPKNIVYIYVDQHRGPMAGFHGHPLVQTPNLDAMALEAVAYPNMFTNSPLCQPARAAMMTGLMPHLNGCWSNHVNSDPALAGSHVKRIHDEAGYYTAVFGKTHLTTTIGHPGDPANVEKLKAWGFDETMELLSQVMCANVENFYSDWLADITPKGTASKKDAYSNYVNTWEHIELNNPPDIYPWLLTTEENVDIWCAQVAADWIRAYDKDQPFYLQVTLPGPHSPFDSTTEFRAMYDEADPLLESAILVAPENPSALLMELIGGKDFGDLTLAQSRQLLLTYYAKITMIDHAVARVIDALKETGLLDTTWLVYGADHGELVGDHMLWGKVAMYEGAIRTPLLVRPPGGTAAWTSEGKIDQLDLTATIVEMAGLQNEATGTSRLAQILGGPGAAGAQTGKDTIFGEIEGAHTPVGPPLAAAMVRRDQYKLVIDLDSGLTSDLYDLEADPDEVNNLFLDPAYSSLIAEMEEEYRAFVEADLAG